MKRWIVVTMLLSSLSGVAAQDLPSYTIDTLPDCQADFNLDKAARVWHNKRVVVTDFAQANITDPANHRDFVGGGSLRRVLTCFNGRWRWPSVE